MPRSILSRLKARLAKSSAQDVVASNTAQGHKWVQPGDLEARFAKARWGFRVDAFAKALPVPYRAALKNADQISPAVRAFTDDPYAQVSLLQTAMASDDHFSLALGIETLDGNYLSLAIALPHTHARSLSSSDLVAVDLDIETEAKLAGEILVRLNLLSGPNIERVVRPLGPSGVVEFDLFYMDFTPERFKDAWVDVIFAPQSRTRIVVKDMRILCCPRAEL